MRKLFFISIQIVSLFILWKNKKYMPKIRQMKSKKQIENRKQIKSKKQVKVRRQVEDKE